MTFNSNADVSGSGAKRRGPGGGAIAGGIGGLGAGTFEQYPQNGTGPASNGVRIELQADCYAGAWVQGMTQQKDASGTPYLQPPTDPQIDDALAAAAAVGDDHIQAQSGTVNPESWTHGSSEQRKKWFTAGYQGGPGACDTFQAAQP